MVYRFYRAALYLPTIIGGIPKGSLPAFHDLKLQIKLRVRQQNTERPDHYYDNLCEHAFREVNSIEQLIFHSTRQLTERHLTNWNGSCRISNQSFPEWQNLITDLSPLPFLAFFYFREHQYRSIDDIVKRIHEKGMFTRSTLPSIYQPQLEHLIEHHGLYDLHIHLNGTTETDQVWQIALARPEFFFQKIRKASQKEKSKEKAFQTSERLAEQDMIRYLTYARVLRDLLCRFFLFGTDISDLPRESASHEDLLTPAHIHPVSSKHKSMLSPLQLEAIFWIYAFQRLQQQAVNHQAACCLFAYLQLTNYFHGFMVQKEDQKGFGQFQKITINDYRNLSEERFKARFFQLDGFYRGDLKFIEGRIAPRPQSQQTVEYLERILGDYRSYRQELQARNVASREPTRDKARASRNPEQAWDHSDLQVSLRPLYEGANLALVAHLIKRPDHNPSELCRHYKLRRDVFSRTLQLIYLRKNHRLARRYLCGVDAASNEMFAPPEVFAPAYREFRRAGWCHFTYHVGEDFVHLLSGIRAVAEALRFLELRDGNRLGHVTALGVEPKLWLKRFSGKMVIAGGEWLDNLIFAYHALFQTGSGSKDLFRLKHEIQKYWSAIYGSGIPNLEQMIEAWKMRALDPLPALGVDQKQDCLNLARRVEWDDADRCKREQGEAFELFKKYHRKGPRQKYGELIEVDAEFLSAKVLRQLQNAVLMKLIEREVVIECMPTSNVRIGPYRSLDEHHIFRWLGLTHKNDPKPQLVLGSDDPGIFATNLRNEFSHIYLALKERVGSPKAIEYLEKLSKNARIFRFKPWMNEANQGSSFTST